MFNVSTLFGRRTDQPPHNSVPRHPLQLEPSSAYELLTRRMVEEIKQEVGFIRSRIDNMFWVVIGSVVLDILLRLAR